MTLDAVAKEYVDHYMCNNWRKLHGLPMISWRKWYKAFVVSWGNVSVN